MLRNIFGNPFGNLFRNMFRNQFGKRAPSVLECAQRVHRGSRKYNLSNIKILNLEQ